MARTKAVGLRRESANPNLAAAREHLAQGSTDIKRERYADAAAQFSAALRKLQSLTTADVALEVRALAGIATLAIEAADMRAIERVRKAIAKTAWPDQVRSEHFAILASLRYGSLLENDTSAAFFEAREAAAVATSVADRALAEINAGVTSGLIGDRHAEKLQLARAWQMLRGEKFSGTDDSAANALLTFAIEAASSMPADARKAMTLYRSLAPKTPGASGTDRRKLAFEAMAAARISDAGGDYATAERLYRKALDLFEALHLDMRAAIVALDLRRITGDDVYAGPIKAVLSRAPRAWFGAQLAAQDGPLERLSPAELIVLAHLVRGDTAKAIGEKLDRSPFTISNHTRRIFQAFEVNSRSKVIAICAELGITPEHVERLAR